MLSHTPILRCASSLFRIKGSDHRKENKKMDIKTPKVIAMAVS
jgi:hypothetical protein